MKLYFVIIISLIIFLLSVFVFVSKKFIRPTIQSGQRHIELSHKLAKYLSPQVYDSLFSGEKEVRIENYQKNLTVLFSDIVGFTPLTEGMSANKISKWLNHYLDNMANIVLRYEGTLDKFIGDAVMVFFGDPITRGEQKDAVKCVLMGIEMQKRASLMNVNIRIGIHTGECTVGNFGSEERMDYTIIGKTVNLAARLESNSKPGQILITDTTYELVKDIVRCEPREKIRVKGINRNIMTYWVLEYDLECITE